MRVLACRVVAVAPANAPAAPAIVVAAAAATVAVVRASEVAAGPLGAVETAELALAYWEVLAVPGAEVVAGAVPAAISAAVALAAAATGVLQTRRLDAAYFPAVAAVAAEGAPAAENAHVLLVAGVSHADPLVHSVVLGSPASVLAAAVAETPAVRPAASLALAQISAWVANIALIPFPSSAFLANSVSADTSALTEQPQPL